MSLTTCALSNSLVTQPVVSKKTGHVFEKSVITKHLESTGQCPLTGQEMSLDDLVDVNPNYSFSRPQTGNVTQSLKRMQTEWDSLMLENFQIRKHLNEMKEELAHNLYQHEAASLVICRLIRERDEALRKLQDFKINVQRVQQEEEEELQNEEEFDFMGIYDNLVEKFNDLSQKLISKRKNREISKTLRNVDQIREYKLKASFPLHSSSKPGITCLDVHPLMSNLIVTGGNDAQLVLFDTNKEKTLFSTAGRGHTKKINDVKFYPGEDLLGFCSAGADSTAYFWLNDTSSENINGDLNFIERYRTNVHRAGITSLSFHPLRDYCLMTSRDKNWSFHNLVKGLCLTKTQTDTDQEITKCQFHPDGLIFATGENNGLLRIWDISMQSAMATLEVYKTEINGLSFSENGYYLATCATRDNCVKIVDLRKSEIVRKIELPEKNYEVKSVKFDHSGSYLGIVGSSVHLYQVKNNQLFNQFQDHTDLVTDIGFGKDCEYMVTSSLDRNLNLYK